MKKEDRKEAKNKRIAIIGSGPNAFGFLIGLLKKIEESPYHKAMAQSLSINIFEKSSIIGAGFPYDETMVDPEHLLNVKTKSPSVPDREDPSMANTESFLRWLSENKEKIEEKITQIFEDRLAKKFRQQFGKEYDRDSKYEGREQALCEHYDKLLESFKKRYLNFEHALAFHPRILYGLYQVVLFDELVQKLEKHGVKITKHPNTEVAGLDKDLNLKYVTEDDNKKVRIEKEEKFDKVIIASGRFYEEQKDAAPNYIQKPWPALILKERVESLIDEQIKKRKASGDEDKIIRIAIEGSRLSAIDVAKTIFQDGIFEETKTGKLVFKPYEREDGYKIQIDMVSRTGVLQAVESSVADAQRIKEFKITAEDVGALKPDENGKIHLWQIIKLVTQKLLTACEKLGVEAPKEVQETLGLITEQEKHQVFDYKELIGFLGKVSSTSGNPIDQLRQNLSDAKAEKLNFYQIFQEIFKPVDSLISYDKLPLHERIFYREFMQSRALTQLVRMPPQSAQELIALSEAGVLNFIRMGKDIQRSTADNGKVLFSSQEQQRSYDIAISSRGNPTDMRKNPSPLFHSMIENGIISSSDFQIGNQEQFEKFQASLIEAFGIAHVKAITEKIEHRADGHYCYQVGNLDLKERHPVDETGSIHNDIIILNKTSGIGTAIQDSIKAAEAMFLSLNHDIHPTSSKLVQQETKLEKS